MQIFLTLFITSLFAFIKTTTIDNLCISRKAYDPEKCSKCVFSFLEENTCKIANRMIPYCLTYSSNTTCKTCEYGHYLISNKTKCLPCKIKDCALCQPNKFNFGNDFWLGRFL